MKQCDQTIRGKSRSAEIGRLIPIIAATAALIAAGGALAQGAGKGAIVVGQTAGFTGPQAALVKEATDAAKAYFEKVNNAGGVNGRKIVLESIDDGFDPKRTVENAAKLINESHVLALFLTRGTANAEALIPMITEHKTPLIAPVAVSKLLHDPPQRYIFNTRPQASIEVQGVIEQLGVMGINRIAVVYTDDAFGKIALEGAKSAFASRSLQPVATISTPRGEPKVAEAVAAVVKADPQAVMGLCIVTTCAELLKQMRQNKSDAHFVSLSNTASGTYIAQLGDYSRGVMVAQVYPNPDSATIPLVKEFQQLVASAKFTSSHTAMEGFIGAKVLVEGIRRSGANPTREGLVKALESMKDYDLGGFLITFSPEKRSGSLWVGLSMISRDRKFIQ
jgi:branched-chain amino acid transport system substrate-binding protein